METSAFHLSLAWRREGQLAHVPVWGCSFGMFYGAGRGEMTSTELLSDGSADSTSQGYSFASLLGWIERGSPGGCASGV